MLFHCNSSLIKKYKAIVIPDSIASMFEKGHILDLYLKIQDTKVQIRNI